METLRGCRVFHFHDTSRVAPVKQQGYISDNRALHPDAGNLAAVLLRLRNNGDHARYQRILRMVKQVAPFLRDFVLEPGPNADRVRLRWQQEGSDTVLPADALSDGTLRFICLTVLLGHQRALTTATITNSHHSQRAKHAHGDADGRVWTPVRR